MEGWGGTKHYPEPIKQPHLVAGPQAASHAPDPHSAALSCRRAAAHLARACQEILDRAEDNARPANIQQPRHVPVVAQERLDHGLPRSLEAPPPREQRGKVVCVAVDVSLGSRGVPLGNSGSDGPWAVGAWRAAPAPRIEYVSGGSRLINTQRGSRLDAPARIDRDPRTSSSRTIPARLDALCCPRLGLLKLGARRDLRARAQGPGPGDGDGLPRAGGLAAAAACRRGLRVVQSIRGYAPRLRQAQAVGDGLGVPAGGQAPAGQPGPAGARGVEERGDGEGLRGGARRGQGSLAPPQAHWNCPRLLGIVPKPLGTVSASFELSPPPWNCPLPGPRPATCPPHPPPTHPSRHPGCGHHMYLRRTIARRGWLHSGPGCIIMYIQPGRAPVGRGDPPPRARLDGLQTRGHTQTHRRADTRTHRHSKHTDTQTHMHTDAHRHTDTQTQTHRHVDSQTQQTLAVEPTGESASSGAARRAACACPPGVSPSAPPRRTSGPRRPRPAGRPPPRQERARRCVSRGQAGQLEARRGQQAHEAGARSGASYYQY